ncbi:MAG: ABC transporter ATP-binding protein [Haloarculaceae archaeon]
MIDVDGVRAAYGDRPVLSGVSLTVPEGETLALVGPNGAGKTTLLRTINGLVEPAAGTVTVDGRRVDRLGARERARLVATVPQETAVAFDFTVRQLVAMGRTPYRSRFGGETPDDRAAVADALDRTDTADLADRSIDAISGGERSRVLLARALAQETPVLLLDEPTASLDINHQVRTLSLVAGLDRTVVAAIHDLDLAARFADRIALLADGTIAAAGPPERVLTADRLRDAFGVRVAVGEDPATGARTVTPLSDDGAAIDREPGVDDPGGREDRGDEDPPDDGPEGGVVYPRHER